MRPLPLKTLDKVLAMSAPLSQQSSLLGAIHARLLPDAVGYAFCPFTMQRLIPIVWLDTMNFRYYENLGKALLATGLSRVL